MKKWIKWTAVICVAVLVLLVVAGSYYWPVWTADCVVRVSYTGFDALFREPYAYYAVCGNNAVRVAPWVLEQIAPEAVSRSKYTDMETTQWFAHLFYVHREVYFDTESFLYRDDPWLPTDFGETYRVYYDRWAGAKRMPDEEEQAILVRAAETFHSGDINDWSSIGGPERGLTWYILVSNGEQRLLQLKEERLYRAMPDGSFEWIMDCPEGGQFDYYWFP